MCARAILTMVMVWALVAPSHGQAVRPAPYNSQLRTAPEVGNVQGIQRYGRTLRTDPDQGEGYSYHVYPVAYPTAPTVVAPEPIAAPPAAQFDFELKKLNQQKEEVELEKDPQKQKLKIANYERTLLDLQSRLQEATQRALTAQMAARLAAQTPPANPNPPLFDSTQGMRRPSLLNGAGLDSGMLADTASRGGKPGDDSQALRVVHQPLIQIKMRVVEVDRSNALLVSSVLDFVGGPGNPNTLINGNNINGNMRNFRGSTRMPSLASLISVTGTSLSGGSGALVNLTTGNMNLIASLLQQEFKADTITAPQVVTLNDQNVEFVAGQRVPFALGQNVITGQNNNIQQFFYKHVGTYVSVTPHIVNWGKGSGAGRAPLMDGDIAHWSELLEDIKGQKLYVTKETMDAIGPFLSWREKGYLAAKDKDLPFAIPVAVKNRILADLSHYPRNELIQRYGSPAAARQACDPACDWRPEDCTIDLEVVLRLSDAGISNLKLSTGPGAATEQTIPTEANVRAMANIVQVKSGHGVIIGGLIAEHDVQDISKVPVLGDIPGVGALFRSKTTSRQKTEVLVFIEAQVLDPCPPVARAQSANDFVFGKAYVAGDFLDNPLERGMYRAGFGTYLPPHSHEERIFWERLGRRVRTIATTIDDVLH